MQGLEAGKHNFIRSSIYRVAYPVHNFTDKSFVRSGMNEICMFITLKTYYFPL